MCGTLRFVPRLSLKPDTSFFRKIALGAVGARAVQQDLDSLGHCFIELENGATDTKLWKEVKRKRVRIPDLACVRCGQRVESRAKSSPGLSMSHSAADAERAWDYGMVDNDLIAFPLCEVQGEEHWSRGQLQENISYWHARERVGWSSRYFINYFRVRDFRQQAHARSSTKGVTEGSETSIAWDAIFSSRDGHVARIAGGKITIPRASDGHVYTWANRKNLPAVVTEGAQVAVGQVLAATVPPVVGDFLNCKGSLDLTAIVRLLQSPERTQRFTGIKLARARQEVRVVESIGKLAEHSDEDLYVRLEAAAYLASIGGRNARQLFERFLSSADDQIRLEAVVALAEAGTPEAVQVLCEILDSASQPFFLRSAAAWALGRIGTPAAVERLLAAFEDVDTSIREESLIAVVGLDTPMFQRLVEATTSGQSGIAAGAAEALRRLAPLPPQALRELAEKATDSSPWPAWLLGQRPGDHDTVSASIASLQESHPEIHFAVSLLWSFLDSWIARSWELYPQPKSREV